MIQPTHKAVSSVGTQPRTTRKPRLGFLGVGWIGRNRMEAVVKSGLAEIAGICDPAAANATKAAAAAPGAVTGECLEELLALGVDGIVIATPSALHAAQAEMALQNGVAVFCQKPLGRNAIETARVIAAAREADRLLGVDLSYRHVNAARQVRDLCRSGQLGKIYAIDLVFHNAYGPDKPWFYDASLSGGGCVIDLGIHLVDMALWALGFPKFTSAAARLYAQGKPLSVRGREVEDYAEARLDLETGACVRLACSWKLQAGAEAIISGAFYGDQGGAGFHNVGGSFYQFAGERFVGTRSEPLTPGPEDWGARAVLDWVQRLSMSQSFDAGIEPLGDVARALDAIYNAGAASSAAALLPGLVVADELS